ncbi:hypothetical protein FO519_001667 [Halicephalobus sp. NKZ332]|nr:hypothetical protein FO519_001667 [Halicephalobus sp. NKZ332]
MAPSVGSKDDATDSESADSSLQQLLKKGVNANISKYELNARVLCRFTDKMFYEAKITNVVTQPDGKIVYTLHYQGWNNRYDEEVSNEDAKTRFIPYDVESAKLAKAAISEARKRKVKKSEKKLKMPKKLFGSKKSSSANSSKSSTAVPEGYSADTGSATKPESSDDEAEDLFDIPTFLESKKSFCEITTSKKLDDILIDDCDIITRQMKVPVLPPRFTVKDIMKEFVKHAIEAANGKQKDEVTEQLKADIDILLYFFNLILPRRLLYKVELTAHVHMLNNYFGKTQKPLNTLNFVEPTFGRYFTADDDLIRAIDAVNEKAKALSNREEDTGNENEGERRSIRVKRNEKLKATGEKSDKKDQRADGNEHTLDCTQFYGIIHLIRFVYVLAQLIKEKAIRNNVINRRVSFINELTNFLGKNTTQYFDANLDYEVPEPALLREAFIH